MVKYEHEIGLTKGSVVEKEVAGNFEGETEELGNCGFDVVDTQEIYFVPTAEEDTASFDLGVKLAKACKEL